MGSAVGKNCAKVSDSWDIVAVAATSPACCLAKSKSLWTSAENPGYRLSACSNFDFRAAIAQFYF
jgi:hypothetical protein